MEEDKKEEIKKILQESLSKMNKKAQDSEEDKESLDKKSHETNNENIIDEEKKEHPLADEELHIREEKIEDLEKTNAEINEEKEINEIKVDKINISEMDNLLPTLIVVATLLLLAIIFSFFKDDLIKDEPVENKPIVMKEVKTPEESIKDNKNTIKEEVTPQSDIKTVKNNNTKDKQTKIIEQKVIKIVEVKKEVLSIPAFRKFYNGTDYEKSTCYNYKAGSTHPTPECKTKIKKFIEKNKDAIRFEIIAVLGEDDFKIFKDLNTKIKNYANNDRIKEFINRGLGRERVLEISWHIKEVLGENVILTPTNYYVKSQKNNKGFLIKAYY